MGKVELGDKTQELAGVLSDSGYGAQTIDEVMTAFDASDNEIGYAFTVTTLERAMAETLISPWAYRKTVH